MKRSCDIHFISILPGAKRGMQRAQPLLNHPFPKPRIDKHKRNPLNSGRPRGSFLFIALKLCGRARFMTPGNPARSVANLSAGNILLEHVLYSFFRNLSWISRNKLPTGSVPFFSLPGASSAAYSETINTVSVTETAIFPQSIIKIPVEQKILSLSSRNISFR